MKNQWDRTIQYIPSVHNVCNGQIGYRVQWVAFTLS